MGVSPTSKPFGFNACQCVLMCINAHLKFALKKKPSQPIRYLEKYLFTLADKILVGNSSCVVQYTHPVTSAYSSVTSTITTPSSVLTDL